MKLESDILHEIGSTKKRMRRARSHRERDRFAKRLDRLYADLRRARERRS